MYNFFSKFLKHKKIFIFAFLVLTLLSFSAPKNVTAILTAPCPPGHIPNPDGTYCIPKPASSSMTNAADEGCTKKWPGIIEGNVKATIAGLVDIVAAIPEVVATLISFVINWIISEVIDWKITTGTDGASTAFQNAWLSTRDFANMFVVLGFVIIGIATALRIQDYAAKKFLFKLIIVALLINFSGLFCGLIIDASRLAMTGLTPTISGGIAEDFRGAIKGKETSLKCGMAQKGYLWSYITTSLTFAVLYSVLALVFVYLAVLLVGRYVILGILYILSPLAFVFYAFPFPKAKDLWNKWWESFIKWAFIGVSLMFFLNIAFQTATSPNLKVTSGMDPFLIFQYMLVVLMIIFVGIKISAKSSGALGVAAMAIAAGTGALAMGAVGGALNKATGGRVNLPGAAEKVKSGVGHVLESAGLMKQGTTDLAKGKSLEDSKKRMGTLDNATMGANISRSPVTMQGMKDKAALIERAVSEGKLDMLGKTAAEQHRNLSFAEGMGISGATREKAQKLNPFLREHNSSMVKQKMKDDGIKDEAVAKKAVVAEGFRGANIGDIREFGTNILESKEFIENTPTNKIKKATDLMSQKKVDSIKKGTQHLRDTMNGATKGSNIIASMNSSAYKEAKEKHDEILGIPS